MSLKNLVGRTFSLASSCSNKCGGSSNGLIRHRRLSILLNNNHNSSNIINNNNNSSHLSGGECRRSLHLTAANSDVYPKYYVQPVYLPEEQERIKETGEAEKLAFVPVRAAESGKNQSCWHDPLVSRFITLIMEDGRKQLARDLMDKTFENIKRIQLEKYHAAADDAARAKIILNPWEIFHLAVENSKPVLETTPIKRGGTTYAVPIPLRDNKAIFMALRWLMNAALEKNENEKRFHKKLAWELLEASRDTGKVVKKKQDLHKLCEANRAFAHFRWQ